MAETDLSTIVKNWVTTVGILGGGLWALWRWRFEEQLRKHRDFPALDGNLTADASDFRDGKQLVTLKAMWRNRGRLPVDIDTQNTSIVVFRVCGTVNFGALKPSSDGLEVIHRVRPLGDSSQFILEPGTDSPIHTCFVLHVGETVLFHYRICLLAKQRARSAIGSAIWCERSLLFNSRSAQRDESASPSDR